MPAARALEALIRLRAPDALDRTRGAFDRRDFDEECWATVLEALADRSDAQARGVLEDFLQRRGGWVGPPSVLPAPLHRAGARRDASPPPSARLPSPRVRVA